MILIETAFLRKRPDAGQMQGKCSKSGTHRLSRTMQFSCIIMMRMWRICPRVAEFGAKGGRGMGEATGGSSTGGGL